MVYLSKNRNTVPLNPFSEEYFVSELAFYGLKEPYSKNGLSVWSDEQGIPFLKFDDTIWMTLKPKIVQTHYLSTSRATGAVLTGGLGLGYFPLRVAAKDNVQRVDVYELDRRVIDFFIERFSDRPEMEKINLIHGDFRELASGHYDYALVDIYTNPVSSISQVFQDLTLLKSRVTVSKIQVWCEELIVKVGLDYYGLNIVLGDNERLYFDYWNQTSSPLGETLNQLYREACYQLSPGQIKSYLSLVQYPIKSYYFSVMKRGLIEGSKKIYANSKMPIKDKGNS